MVSKDDFGEFVLGHLAPEPTFKPYTYYDPDGDCIEFVARPEPFRAERVDRWVTVYYGQESGELVGSQIKSIQRLLKEVPGFRGLSIRDGRVELTHVLQATGWTEASDRSRILVYERLIEEARLADAQVELEQCGA